MTASDVEMVFSTSAGRRPPGPSPRRPDRSFSIICSSSRIRFAARFIPTGISSSYQHYSLRLTSAPISHPQLSPRSSCFPDADYYAFRRSAVRAQSNKQLGSDAARVHGLGVRYLEAETAVTRRCDIRRTLLPPPKTIALRLQPIAAATDSLHSQQLALHHACPRLQLVHRPYSRYPFTPSPRRRSLA